MFSFRKGSANPKDERYLAIYKQRNMFTNNIILGEKAAVKNLNKESVRFEICVYSMIRKCCV
jgi:hypothetical protein